MLTPTILEKNKSNSQTPKVKSHPSINSNKLLFLTDITFKPNQTARKKILRQLIVEEKHNSEELIKVIRITSKKIINSKRVVFVVILKHTLVVFTH